MHNSRILKVNKSILRGAGSTWTVYDFSIDNQKVFLISRHTIAKMFKATIPEVQKFIVSNQMPILEVFVEDAAIKKKVFLTPLSTAVSYWKYIQENEFTKTEYDKGWKNFMQRCEELSNATAKIWETFMQSSDKISELTDFKVQVSSLPLSHPTDTPRVAG